MKNLNISKICLEKMEFHAYHGCLDHEIMLGNTFIVNLSFEIDTEKASKSDNLEDTLNYQLIYDVVNEQMAIPSKLIEHVIKRISDKLWNDFPQLLSLQLKLSKLNPPLGGKVESVSIERALTR